MIRNNKGEVRFNCGAKKIIIKNSKAVGVVTESGEELTADVIVSNISPTATYFDLIDPQDVPKDAVRYLSNFKPSKSLISNLEFAGGFVGLCGFSPNYIQGYKKANEILKKYWNGGI
ncbi:hypothetical protein SAMN05421842_12543 [Clostridium uliginosum]|uniref:Amine oxidase domain-containing protein n=1 Tax=Clostridium uliginosum TaxID=119641 RepID=A0A1I1QK20_9CLOT|nr:hypothetical protein SAMN05421842_12543 [Clostridium uliginosum]